MKKIIKFFIGFVAVFALVFVALHFYGSTRLASAPAVSVAKITPDNSDAAISRGRHLAEAVSGCADCHAADFGGQTMPGGPPNAVVTAPNLTPGIGSVTKNYTQETWVRSIAHGVGGDGRALIIMPSDYYSRLSAYDLAALVAYLYTLPPVDRTLPATKIGFPASIIFGVLAYEKLAVNTIQHTAVGQATQNTQSAQYLINASGCISCHGKNLAGRTTEMGPPPGPNLTTLEWTTDQFIHALSTGTRPDGTKIKSTMPSATLGKMTPAEMTVIWEYVLSLPDRALDDNS